MLDANIAHRAGERIFARDPSMVSLTEVPALRSSRGLRLGYPATRDSK